MDDLMTGRIPFLDLVTPHAELEAELVNVFTAALHRAAFVGGSAVEQFEHEFAQASCAAFAVGAGSGTDALRFALLAAGVKAGEIVITVPNTFAATVEAILQAGARPDFVDIDPRTFNMDVGRLQDYLDRLCEIDTNTGALVHCRTRRRVAAVLPVHLYGQMAAMDPILDIAERYQLKVIEDACQAHGALYFSEREQRWKVAGSVGAAGAFSFYPGKNLGACGEGGAVTTNDPDLAARVRMLRDHGQPRKYYHDLEGYNGRLDAIQAGILSVKLKHLSEWNRQRRSVAGVYNDLLRDVTGVVRPSVPKWAEPVYHLYVVRVQDRSALQEYLTAQQIDTGIHYPIPLHLQRAFQTLGYAPGDFPVTECAAREILSLPMYPHLAREQQQKVVQAIREFSAGVEAPGAELVTAQS
jgi:dTDP-4-amino-4,6-dideoxygalactose transaminase